MDRATPWRRTARPHVTPVVDAVVLAAGASRRMAPWNKLLLVGADGRPLIAHTLANVRQSMVRRVHVVLGHQAAQVAAAIAAPDVTIVACPDFAKGLSHSLRAGLLSLNRDATAVIICLGDMPWVSAACINSLIDAWRPGSIVAPTYQGQRGNPVLWDACYSPAMTTLRGDDGAKTLLAAHAAQLHLLDLRDPMILHDADTPDALRDLPGGPWHAPDGTPICSG